MYSKLLIILLFSAAAVEAQVTGDTSFTVYSAYRKVINRYPGIEIAAGENNDRVKTDSNIKYCSIGNRPLLMDAFYPADPKVLNGISIVIVHGGGWRSGSRMMHYPLAQKLAAMGYTCFTPGYRLSGEAVFPAAVYDIKSAVQWVKQHSLAYHTDSSKTVLLGFSAGGELAAFAATTSAVNLFEGSDCKDGAWSGVRALVDIDGTLSFVHPESSEGDDSKKLSAATQWLGVPKKDNLKLWQEASPLMYAGKYSPPTLFINSSVMPMHAGREDYIRILTENNIYTEVHSFDNSPHTFCLFHPWFLPTVNYIDGFLAKVFATKTQ